MGLAAKNNDPDTPDIRTALEGESADEFKKAMKKEIKALQDRKTWIEVPEKKLPPGARVIPTT